METIEFVSSVKFGIQGHLKASRPQKSSEGMGLILPNLSVAFSSWRNGVTILPNF